MSLRFATRWSGLDSGGRGCGVSATDGGMRALVVNIAPDRLDRRTADPP